MKRLLVIIVCLGALAFLLFIGFGPQFGVEFGQQLIRRYVKKSSNEPNTQNVQTIQKESNIRIWDNITHSNRQSQATEAKKERKIVDTETKQTADPFSLNEAIIENLFENRTNEERKLYGLIGIKWHEGSFTKTNTLEALVSFLDATQVHGSRWSEVWLLQFESEWKINRKLEEADQVEFEVLDIEKDGRLEAWIRAGGGNQGYFSDWGNLIRIEQGSVSILYSNEGFDYTGAGAEGEVIRSHSVEFRDIDNDGVLEITDLEERVFFRKKTESEEGSDYTTSKRTVFKLIDGKFKIIQVNGSE